MLAVMKKLKYDDEYNFENEVNRTAGLLSTVSFQIFSCRCLCIIPMLIFVIVMLISMGVLTEHVAVHVTCQGEDEAMFVEYRKQLKMLLDRLAQVSPELLLEAVRRFFANAML